MARQRWRLTPAAAGGRGCNGASSGGGHCLSIIINVTIFLPKSEGVFVDANDPLLAWYREAGDRAEGTHCEMSVFGDSKMMMNATMYSWTCDIKFVHPGGDPHQAAVVHKPPICHHLPHWQSGTH